MSNLVELLHRIMFISTFVRSLSNVSRRGEIWISPKTCTQIIWNTFQSEYSIANEETNGGYIISQDDCSIYTAVKSSDCSEKDLRIWHAFIYIIAQSCRAPVQRFSAIYATSNTFFHAPPPESKYNGWRIAGTTTQGVKNPDISTLCNPMLIWIFLKLGALKYFYGILC